MWRYGANTTTPSPLRITPTPKRRPSFAFGKSWPPWERSLFWTTCTQSQDTSAQPAQNRHNSYLCAAPQITPIPAQPAHTPLGVWSVDKSPTPKTVVDLSPRGAETPPAEYDEATAQRWLETAPEEVQEAYRQRVKLYSQSPSMERSGQALRKTWEQFHRQEVA